jgi:hypothetical protein
MQKKKMIRMLSIILVISSLAFVYTYAQQAHKKNISTADAVPPEVVDKEEDTGVPTGDDPWEEMNNLVTAYYNDHGVYYKGNIKLIDDNGDKEKILENHPFEYSFFNGDFQYTLDSMEFINQQSYVLAIDYRGKFISFSRGPGTSAAGKLFDIDAFKKLMVSQKAHAVITQSGNEKMITIDSIQDPQIQGYRIYYDPQTYKIEKMLIGMVRLTPLEDPGQENYTETTAGKAPGQPVNETEEDEDTELTTYSYYVEIHYNEGHSLALQKGQFNPVQKFVKIGGDKIELQPAYGNYELINTPSGNTDPDNQ